MVHPHLLVKVMDLEYFMLLNLFVKVFKLLKFLNFLMNLNSIVVITDTDVRFYSAPVPFPGHDL